MAALKPAQSPSGATLLGRRDLLSRLGRWLLAGSAAGLAFVGLRPLWPRVRRGGGVRLSAGRADALAPGQVDSRLLREHWVWVVRDAGGVYALSARCTHLGCRLRLDAAQARFSCNCHGSRFSLAGEVLRGPATRHLDRLGIALTPDGELEVDPALRYRQEHGEWDAPGAYVALPARKGRGA